MLNVFRKIIQDVTKAESLDQALSVLVKSINEYMCASACSVYLYDIDQRCFVLEATEGLNPESVGVVKLAVSEGLVGQVVVRKESLNIADASCHPHYRYFPVAKEDVFHAFLGVPVIHKRKVIGVLVVQNRDVREFSESEESFLLTIAVQLAAVLANAEASGAVTDPSPSTRAVKFKGIAASVGTGLGKGLILYPAARLESVPEKTTENIGHECFELEEAVKAVKREVSILAERMSSILKPEEHALFDVYLRMLDDHALPQEIRHAIESNTLWVQSALRHVIEAHVRTFEAMDDPYIRERAADVRDLGVRILAHLQQRSKGDPKQVTDNVILMGEDISTSWLMDLPLEYVKGIATQEGASNSHMSIVARALNIPAVVGVSELPLKHLEDKHIVVDGYAGEVIANPSNQELDVYIEACWAERQFFQKLLDEQDLPCVTSDGFPMDLWVNSGLMVDVGLSKACGACGVGLYRTEIPFMDRECFPSENEQRAIYRAQLELFAPLPVVMRTLDIGGDKSLPYLPIYEANPFLGWRGLRITLDHPEIFMQQIKAMLFASQGLDNLRIMLPMVSSVVEVDEALSMIRRAHLEVIETGANVKMPAVGAMIEVPAAVYLVKELADRVDFLSVGTNDLTQYLLAVDRNNRRVADLYQSLHPAVLRALREIVIAADRANKPVSVCGEMAADPMGIVLLMGMGYRQFSMSPAKLLEMKWVIRRMTFAKARKVIEDVMGFETPQLVKHYLEMMFTHLGLADMLHPDQSCYKQDLLA